MQRGDDPEKKRRTEVRNSTAMIGGEAKQAFKIEDDEDVFSDVWCLREEYQIASKALRTRSCSQRISSSSDQEETMMKSTTSDSRATRRPDLIHRKTDPLPLREFTKKREWDYKENKINKVVEEKDQGTPATISEEDEEEIESLSIPKKMLDEEEFLISSYDLARRRLSLPLSTTNHSWNEEKVSWNEEETASSQLNDPENCTSCTPLPIKSYNRLCLKQLDHSTMEKRRRQSAWTRRPSIIHDELNKSLSKRRMSELPALSALATRRRSVPHTLSVPLGLRRKGSRIGSDYQTVNTACTRAKNEMLATLSMTSWLDNGTARYHDSCRRKSCHTGFGIMALKKKEEKRLMVAHEILQTEKNYIKTLETLNEVFVEPFKNACVIPEKDFRTMFPKTLHGIKNGHVKFMNELDHRLNNWKWQGVLGDIFAKLGNSYHVDFMTLYSEYVNNFPKSIAVINKYSRNSHKFRKLLQKCNSHPRCERLNISAFLLSPIQRLPRYVLLLRQLAKYTDSNHPDSFHIEISLEKMIDIINILNSSIQNSTRIARNTSSRHSSRRRRKRNIFKAKETVPTDTTSSRKSDDDSECSESSTPSGPCAKDATPLTIDITSPDQQNRSSDYGSLTNSEAASEPASPIPSSSSSSRSNFLKVILRNNGESKKNKRRPLSTTEVEIIHRKHNADSHPKHEELKRSASRDSFGSALLNKFGSFRRNKRSSDESLSRDQSLERLDDCKVTLFRYSCYSPEENQRAGDDERKACSQSDSDLLEEKHTLSPETVNSGSSMESCDGLRDHLAVSCPNRNSDSDDSRSKSPDSRPNSRLSGDVIDNNNQCDELNRYLDSGTGVVRRRKNGYGTETSDDKLTRRKLGKRNSFTNVMKQFFGTKTRSSSNSPETMGYLDSQHNEQIVITKTSKEKISTV